ncbi:Pkinase domain-containing protein/LRR_8 domain-containing protein [Cephalotus follicularis]|uniref:non-specific serine/threonine protein kinase n=1 Tax=Cephalotus follicularis TaxID=3775 RepID=A0A1Q3AVN7_CEPFO|nr:Pkinase domain-containing protein/LRR_8 domain-containing protein [Cephalotus follicularis]
MGLKGTLDVDSLKQLPVLRTLSFMNNNFEGPLPELKKLGALKSVYLSNNHFSGVIAKDAFAGMLSLKKLYLAQNAFTGAIPASLTTLPKLMELRLEDNQFGGQIPNFQQKELQVFNVSNNALEGSIPAGLSNFNANSFAGINGLCGKPLKACDPSTPVSPGPSSTSTTSSKRPSILTIVVVAIVGLVALLALIGAICILCRRNREPLSLEAPLPSNLQRKAGIKESNKLPQGSHENSGNNKKSENMKLSFVRDDREKFDLQDLLKASAEILGSGSFGSSYKAALMNGQTMVVKRFKQMNNVGREEFQEHMRRLGRLRHPNLLPLVSYYYRKEEKLLVSDYVERGSLAVHLHGHQGLGLPSLDWPTRLKVIKGVTKGLAYLYKELPSLIAPHGHLKSSNVLVNESYEPLLTDYGLIPVVNQESAQELMVAYKSPEYLQQGRITKKTDVWGLGILILEILTGKFPANFLQHGKGSEEDLAIWVSSVVGQEVTNEVFDNEMATTKNNEGELRKLLTIGLACCEGDVEKRLDMKEAIQRIEEVKERDGDEDFTSCVSEAEIKSSGVLSDEFSYS